MLVRLGQRNVGRGRPVYMVAEAGVNHNGNLATALRLVTAAKEIGADAVKFQVFTPSELATRSAETPDYQKPFAGGGQWELLERLALPIGAFRVIRKRCTEVGIDFLATPFSLVDLKALVELSPVAIKLASTDLNNSTLMVEATATGLPLIVSTGAATEGEVARAISWLNLAQATGRTVVLHCVSCYPTADVDANLLRIAALAQQFRVLVGYSDHTLSEQTGALAVAAGACLIEKHFTLDQAQPGPDHAASLEPAAMHRFIRAVRQAEVLCGAGTIDFAPCEAEIRDKSRRSVVARQEIRPGQRIEADMLGVKRPGGGIEPWQLEGVIGRTAAVTIPPDGRITWEMLQ
jgi:N,N'-diacetyllegionaminate synthase